MSTHGDRKYICQHKLTVIILIILILLTLEYLQRKIVWGRGTVSAGFRRWPPIPQNNRGIHSPLLTLQQRTTLSEPKRSKVKMTFMI